jgi:E3 ubiquitin-protein ligase ZNF598
LFTNAELRKHEKYGDDNPGAIDQSGFRGHPDCGFCRERFYGDDELYAHCRDKHERCHICDRRVSNRQHQYYINYDALEDHFQKEHFLCLDKECLEKKFVVFETQMDLKAHQLEAHPHGLSKDARRDARLVDMSNFDYRTPYQPQRQRRDGQGAGRGRDPNADPIPISSAQPMRRDELAYQRQVAIQSAQSVSTRSFGGQLTSTNTQPAREPGPASRAADPTSAQANAASHTPPTARMENLSLISDINFASLPPQEQARRLRHNMVIERAASLLRNDQSKLAEFRTKVSNYRTSVINATELIDSFFFLFDASSSDLGKLIKELAEIYEDESKKNALLKAWNDWRAINEDYPALPGPSGALPGMNSSTGLGSAAGGKRVLRLKSSTAQSSRAAAVGRGVSIAGAINVNNIFPPLPATTRMSANAPAWGGVSSTPSGTSPSLGSRPSGTSPRTGTPALSSDEAFPALPAAPKPNTLMAGLTRGTVRWNDHRPISSGNIWGASSPGLGSRSGAGNDEGFSNLGAHGTPAGGNTGKGKGKKQKQTLFHFG